MGTKIIFLDKLVLGRMYFLFTMLGPKKSLCWFKNYIVVLSADQKTSSTKKLATITLFDIKSHFIAYSAQFNDVMHVINEFGSIFIIQGDGKVWWC